MKIKVQLYFYYNIEILIIKTYTEIYIVKTIISATYMELRNGSN
jgi:hypothetical protein